MLLTTINHLSIINNEALCDQCEWMKVDLNSDETDMKFTWYHSDTVFTVVIWKLTVTDPLRPCREKHTHTHTGRSNMAAAHLQPPATSANPTHTHIYTHTHTHIHTHTYTHIYTHIDTHTHAWRTSDTFKGGEETNSSCSRSSTRILNHLDHLDYWRDEQDTNKNNWNRSLETTEITEASWSPESSRTSRTSNNQTNMKTRPDASSVFVPLRKHLHRCHGSLFSNHNDPVQAPLKDHWYLLKEPWKSSGIVLETAETFKHLQVSLRS